MFSSFSHCSFRFFNVSRLFSMFHGFFHCLAAGNNERSRQTLFQQLFHCFSRRKDVSGGGASI
jgi:hypothetical protein